KTTVNNGMWETTTSDTWGYATVGTNRGRAWTVDEELEEALKSLDEHLEDEAELMAFDEVLEKEAALIPVA
ncbi:hypothetical protein EJ06DRAFT_526125, partial [Trichodelitschia bisporula]